jgi:hypothetical protein
MIRAKGMLLATALVAASVANPAHAATFNLYAPLALDAPELATLSDSTATTSAYTVIHTGNKEFKMSDSEVGAIGSNPATSPPSHDIPNFAGFPAPTVGVTYDGDVAITHQDGQFDLSNSHVYAQPGGGINCEAAFSSCDDGRSNSLFFAEGGPASGVSLNNNAGAQQDQTAMGEVRDALDGLHEFLFALDPTGFLVGSLNNETLSQYFGSGLHVIDIDVGANDFLINNSSLLFEGDADAFVILRMTNEKSILGSNANILVGGDMGLNNVLFLSQAIGDNPYTFNNVYFNGIAWWALVSDLDKGATWNDVKGCGQVINAAVNFQNVSMNNCAFEPTVSVSPVPIPAALPLFGTGLAAMGLIG